MRDRDPLQRLYELKLTLLAAVFVVVGIVLLLLGHAAAVVPDLHWLANLPVNDLGGTLFTTGLVVVAFEYLDGEDSETRAAARLRRILKEQAPAMRDAVIDGFAFDSEDLKRVASPEVLDQVSRNSLAIQLGDRSFAQAVYNDLKTQTIRAGERREDLRIQVRLSHWERGPSEARTPLLVAEVRWEYTVVPTANVRRFTCVSDPAEYRELTADAGGTSVYHFVPVDGLDGGSPEAFELTSFTVDGKERPIRRSVRDGSQTYSTSMGQQAVTAGKPVRVAYTYRTAVRLDGHLFHIRLGQPTNGLSVELQYGGTGIQAVSVLDFFASGHPARITTSEQSTRLTFDGWALPASGVVFVWTVEDRQANLHRSR